MPKALFKSLIAIKLLILILLSSSLAGQTIETEKRYGQIFNASPTASSNRCAAQYQASNFGNCF